MRENTINHCAMCDIQAGAEEYDMHMIKVHKHPGKDINHSRTKMPSKRPKKKCHIRNLVFKYQCPLCEHGSNFIANLSIHMHGHIRTSYCCKFCDFKSKNSTNFRAHFNKIHPLEQRKKGWISLNTIYHCAICDINADVREYENHMIYAHNLPVGHRIKSFKKN